MHQHLPRTSRRRHNPQPKGRQYIIPCPSTSKRYMWRYGTMDNSPERSISRGAQPSILHQQAQASDPNQSIQPCPQHYQHHGRKLLDVQQRLRTPIYCTRHQMDACHMWVPNKIDVDGSNMLRQLSWGASSHHQTCSPTLPRNHRNSEPITPKSLFHKAQTHAATNHQRQKPPKKKGTWHLHQSVWIQE